ncbi:hypothetical protein ACFY2M_40655 [Streptomyces sp. NPDC001276]|uniref:hypothetical protein n=1 Tax=Streptomyces sp. NPDC001276 TaxID=3364555 RepID=UPI003681003C
MKQLLIPAAGLRLDLETYADLRFLVLRGGRIGGGAFCDAWPVEHSGGRSVLSAVPAITDPCGGGRLTRHACETPTS